MITIKNKTMLIPPEERIVGVEGDNNTSVRVFSIQRNKYDIDLTGLSFSLEFRYLSGAKNTTSFEDKIVSDKDIQLTWQVRENDLKEAGTLLANVKGTDVNGVLKWRSFVGAFFTAESFNVAENYAGDLTIYEAILARCIQVEDEEVNRAIAEELRKSNNSTWALQEANRISRELKRSLFENFVLDKQYYEGNKVSYNGSSYYCISDSKGVIPEHDTSKWLLMAAKGEQGHDAAFTSFNDQYGFQISEDGYLKLICKDSAPNMKINDSGELILTI